MKKLTVILGSMALVCAMVSAVQAGGAEADETEKEEAPKKTKFERPEVPEEYAELEVPDLKDEDRIEEGEKIYRTHCEVCHGKEGEGDGPAGQALKPPCEDLTDPELQDAMSDPYIYWRIVVGGKPRQSGMTSFDGTLTEDQVWQVTAYVRSLDPEPEEESEPEYLDEEAFEDLMEDDIKAAWGDFKKALKGEDAVAAAKAATALAEHAGRINLCDLDLEGEEGKKLRDQEDFATWATELAEHATAAAGHADKGNWEELAKSKETIGKTCKSCHDVYKP